MTDVAKCSEGMAASGFPPEKTVQCTPPGPPELLAVLDHHAAQLGCAAVVHEALRRRVPGRRGGHRPVADHADVERRVQQRGAAREALAVAHQQIGGGPVGDVEPHPVRPHEQPLETVDAPRAPERALQAQRRRVPEPEHGVRAHRVGDAHAALERRGVVVGHLVGGEVGPHLQAADEDVARARARHEHAERERRRAAVAVTAGRRQPQTTAEQGRRHAGGERRARGRADGGRRAHGPGDDIPNGGPPGAGGRAPQAAARRRAGRRPAVAAPSPAAATNEAMMPLPASASGCHCTPSA